jgi:hypothetical protein
MSIFFVHSRPSSPFVNVKSAWGGAALSAGQFVLMSRRINVDAIALGINTF